MPADLTLELTKRAYCLTDSEWDELSEVEQFTKLHVTELMLQYPDLRGL